MTTPDDSSIRSSIRFRCRRCFARLTAAKDRAGSKLRCPRCQLMLTVPAETSAECQGAEYSLNGAGRTSAAADRQYVSVACPVCKTLMHAGEEEVGREMTCPDCGTAVIVPPPRPKRPPGKPATAAPGEIYPLREAEEGSSAAPPAERRYIAVHCPVCNTLMHATEEQIGRQIVCPDCETRTLVPRPPRSNAKRSSADFRVGADDIYDAGQPIETPRYEVGADYRQSNPAVEGTLSVGPDRQSDSADLALSPPRRPLLSGVFGFPFSTGARGRWLGLSVGALLAMLPAAAAFSLAAGPGAGYGSIGPWIMALALSGTAALLGLGWAAVMAVDFLTILRDTSYGYEKIENWPRGACVDWVGEAFYVLDALGIGMLLSLAVGRGLGMLGAPVGMFTAIGLWLLFPILLLSMLETNSPLNPLSRPVWLSLVLRWKVWAMFYAETAALFVAFGFLPAVLIAVPPLAILAPLLLVAVLMIYARLLGRLTWCCSGESKREVASTRP